MPGERSTTTDGAPLLARPFLRLSLAAEALAIREALRQVVAALAGLRLTGECLGDVELVLAEILNNIHRHAYAGRTGEIELELAAAGDMLVCTVIDAGHPMPGGQLPAGRAVSVDVCSEILPEGGFGWFLIRSYAERLEYRREAGRNHLTLHLRLMPAGHGEQVTAVSRLG